MDETETTLKPETKTERVVNNHGGLQARAAGATDEQLEGAADSEDRGSTARGGQAGF